LKLDKLPKGTEDLETQANTKRGESENEAGRDNRLFMTRGRPHDSVHGVALQRETIVRTW